MPFDIFSQFATDTALEEEGKQIDLAEGAYVIVARVNNKTYNRMLNKLMEAHKQELDKKGPDAEYRSEQIMLELMSKTILLGWGGPNFVWKGQPLPYSVENSRMMLEIKDFREFINMHSRSFQNYRLISEEEDAKKLETTSDGTSPGDQTSNSLKDSGATSA